MVYCQSLKRIVTIGVYGWTEERFVADLREHQVEVVVDVRQRRGVRGSSYRFANAKALSDLLHQNGIEYIHLKQLAPTQEIRLIQKQKDKDGKIRKRNRTHLSPEFVEVYTQQIQHSASDASFLDSIHPRASVVALLCVEREPEACHRSILADFLSQKLALEVVHLRP